MTMPIISFGLLFVLVGALRVWWEFRKREKSEEPDYGDKAVKKAGTLQDYLPLDRYHETGPMLVDKQFRQQIRVGDVNLYSMSLEEIAALRDLFKESVKGLDNPFQISVQARRANYHDYVEYATEHIDEACEQYQNKAFLSFSEKLKRYLKKEAMTPRTDRENIVVVEAIPKSPREKESSQLERLVNEQDRIESGLLNMGISYSVLDSVESVEALQNFWNRERAVHQRYRNLLRRQVHVPIIQGAEVTEEDAIQTREEIEESRA